MITRGPCGKTNFPEDGESHCSEVLSLNFKCHFPTASPVIHGKLPTESSCGTSTWDTRDNKRCEEWVPCWQLQTASPDYCAVADGVALWKIHF